MMVATLVRPGWMCLRSVRVGVPNRIPAPICLTYRKTYLNPRKLCEFSLSERGFMLRSQMQYNAKARNSMHGKVANLVRLFEVKAIPIAPEMGRGRRGFDDFNLPRLSGWNSWPERQIFSTTRVTGSRRNPMSQGGSHAHGLGRNGSRGCSQRPA